MTGEQIREDGGVTGAGGGEEVLKRRGWEGLGRGGGAVTHYR